MVLLQHPIQVEKAHDIWALGIMLFAMATRNFPWLVARMEDKHYSKFVSGSFATHPLWMSLSNEMVEVCSMWAAPPAPFLM